MNTPKVSICIPTYKQVEYLYRSLESIQAQTFKNYEVIITDDTPDDSVKKAVEMFDFQGKLKYLKNLPRLGSPKNFNEAILHAKGDYIKVMMHDDWFMDESSLEKFIALLDNNPDADFGFSSSFHWTKDPEKRWTLRASANQLNNLRRDPKSLFFGNVIGMPSVTIFRKTVEERFDPNLRCIVDLEFYIRVLQSNKNFAFCHEPLVCVVEGLEHQVSTTCCGNNKELDLFEYLYVFKKNQDSKLLTKHHADFLGNLFVKYKVKSYQEVRELGVQFSPQVEYWLKLIILKFNLKALRNSVVSSLKRLKLRFWKKQII